MDASWNKSAWSLLALAPLLAGCVHSPETNFDWGINDRLPKQQYAGKDVTRGDLAKVYVVQGESYAVPAPKPRPVYSAPLSAPAYKAPNTRTASYQPTAKESGDAPVFVWPVSGNVISNFGAVSSGERNDGINIAARANTPIRAAASGTVNYADSLNGYGNLVLIKHSNGYVTAYAHAARLLVAQGDYVMKGQVIGYAGQTGDVNSPQVHFEIRNGTTPVNPERYLSARAGA